MAKNAQVDGVLAVSSEHSISETGRSSRYTDVRGIAAHLAITERHVRRLVLEHRIPRRKIGNLLRFDIDEVDCSSRPDRFGYDSGLMRSNLVHPVQPRSSSRPSSLRATGTALTNTSSSNATSPSSSAKSASWSWLQCSASSSN